MVVDAVAEMLARVDPSRLRSRLFRLSQNPLPHRKANAVLPGHSRSTLDEADEFIADSLAAVGYEVRWEPCQAQAFRCDATKPPSQQYSPASPGDPWYTLHNLYAERVGQRRPAEIVLLVAHKDSQSWNDSPGAYDNAVGTVALLEIATLLREWKPERTIRFLFCNEEHTPWTSNTAAQQARLRSDNLVAILNTDSLGGKADACAGHWTNVTQYASPEGKRIADLMELVNRRYGLDLQQTAQYTPTPGDDHGVFFRHGFRAAIMNVGSLPYADPNYHLLTDTPDRVDLHNVVAATRAVLATALILSLAAEEDPAFG